MFPSASFKEGRKPSHDESAGKLLKTKKVGKIRLHSMVKMRESDLRTIGEAYHEEADSNRS